VSQLIANNAFVNVLTVLEKEAEAPQLRIVPSVFKAIEAVLEYFRFVLNRVLVVFADELL